MSEPEVAPTGQTATTSGSDALSVIAAQIREEAREVDYPSGDLSGRTVDDAWVQGYAAGVLDATARYDELLAVPQPPSRPSRWADLLPVTEEMP